jgi:hypothetical protein
VEIAREPQCGAETRRPSTDYCNVITFCCHAGRGVQVRFPAPTPRSHALGINIRL